MKWDRYPRGITLKPSGYPRGITMKRKGSRPYQFIAFATAVTLLTGLLVFIAAYLVGVSEKLERIESQLRVVDTQLRNVDSLAAASMVAPRGPQRVKESQMVPPPSCPDMSAIESRLSSLQFSIGGFGRAESVKSQLDELKSQLAMSCRR